MSRAQPPPPPTPLPLTAPGATPPPVRVGGDISQPSLIYSPKPVYPASARNSDIQDFVQLVAIIEKDGTISSLVVDDNRPSSGNAELVKAAIDSVRQWRYKPGMLNGQPIAVTTSITVNFTLQ